MGAIIGEINREIFYLKIETRLSNYLAFSLKFSEIQQKGAIRRRDEISNTNTQMIEKLFHYRIAIQG